MVGTLAVVYGLTNFIDTDELALVGGANEVAMVMGLTKVAALAYLMFNLFTPPCFAALGAMNSEMQDKRWLWGGIALQLATGYTVAFFVYQVGTLITTGTLGNGFVPGLIAVAAFAGALLVLIQRNEKLSAPSIVSTHKKERIATYGRFVGNRYPAVDYRRCGCLYMESKEERR